MSKRERERGLFGQAISAAQDLETVRVVTLAARLGRRHLTPYAHPKSPHKFTQPQLFACLILKAHLGCTYRRCEEMLELMPAVRQAIGLVEVPRFTTLQMFADRPEIMTLIDGVLASIGRAVNKAAPGGQDAAIDGTGLETSSAGAHFTSVSGRKRTKYVKVMLGVLCASVIPISVVVDWGPSHDMKQAWALREKIKATTRPNWLWGDGAYDCEAWHKANWQEWGVPNYAPTTVKSHDGTVNGVYRNLFQHPAQQYGRRWSCETVNSGMKRTTGSVLRSRKQHTLFAEAALKVAAYAVRL